MNTAEAQTIWDQRAEKDMAFTKMARVYSDGLIDSITPNNVIDEIQESLEYADSTDMQRLAQNVKDKMDDTELGLIVRKLIYRYADVIGEHKAEREEMPRMCLRQAD